MSQKKMSAKQFRLNGYLMEINRRFLHPLGMALEIVTDQHGNERFGDIWDARNEPDGIIYNEDLFTTEEKTLAEAFEHFQKDRHDKRKQHLGYIVQPINVTGEDIEGVDHADKEEVCGMRSGNQ